MKCLYCGRPLSNPVSIAKGAGPVCSSNTTSRAVLHKTYSSTTDFLNEAESSCFSKTKLATRPKHFFVQNNKPLLVKTDIGLDTELDLETDSPAILVSLSQEESEAEYVCNVIADILNLPVSKFGYHVIENRKYFATEMFTYHVDKKRNTNLISSLIPIKRLLEDHKSDITINIRTGAFLYNKLMN